MLNCSELEKRLSISDLVLEQMSNKNSLLETKRRNRKFAHRKIDEGFVKTLLKSSFQVRTSIKQIISVYNQKQELEAKVSESTLRWFIIENKITTYKLAKVRGAID